MNGKRINLPCSSAERVIILSFAGLFRQASLCPSLCDKRKVGRGVRGGRVVVYLMQPLTLQHQTILFLSCELTSAQSTLQKTCMLMHLRAQPINYSSHVLRVWGRVYSLYIIGLGTLATLGVWRRCQQATKTVKQQQREREVVKRHGGKRWEGMGEQRARKRGRERGCTKERGREGARRREKRE